MHRACARAATRRAAASSTWPPLLRAARERHDAGTRPATCCGNTAACACVAGVGALSLREIRGRRDDAERSSASYIVSHSGECPRLRVATAAPEAGNRRAAPECAPCRASRRTASRPSWRDVVPDEHRAGAQKRAALARRRSRSCYGRFARVIGRRTPAARFAKNAATPSCRSLLSKICCCADGRQRQRRIERHVLRRVDQRLREPVRQRAARRDGRRQRDARRRARCPRPRPR